MPRPEGYAAHDGVGGRQDKLLYLLARVIPPSGTKIDSDRRPLKGTFVMTEIRRSRGELEGEAATRLARVAQLFGVPGTSKQASINVAKAS